MTMNPSLADCPLSPGEDLLSRRRFMGTPFGAVLAGQAAGAAASKKRLRVAAIYSVFSYRGHAHVLLQNFLKPYYFCGRLTHSDMDVVSFHADQIAPRRDMTREVARQFDVEVFPTVEARCAGAARNWPSMPSCPSSNRATIPLMSSGNSSTRASSTSMKS